MGRGHSTGTVSLSVLRHVIEQGNLAVHYQPKIDLRSRQIIGVEALVRWNDPQYGPMTTEDLVRLAEDSGLICSMSEFVIRTAMRDLVRWTAGPGGRDLSLAVNISGVQLRQDGLAPMLDRLIDETGFRRDRLEVEITETATMLAGPMAAATLHALKQRGFLLAIDDFGTGIVAQPAGAAAGGRVEDRQELRRRD